MCQDQYVENSPNLLVLVSDSNAVGGSDLETGVVQFDKMVAKSNTNSPLRRLSAVMLIDEVNELWIGQDHISVYFCPTALRALISSKMTKALAGIRKWSWPVM